MNSNQANQAEFDKNALVNGGSEKKFQWISNRSSTENTNMSRKRNRDFNSNDPSVVSSSSDDISSGVIAEPVNKRRRLGDCALIARNALSWMDINMPSYNIHNNYNMINNTFNPMVIPFIITDVDLSHKNRSCRNTQSRFTSKHYVSNTLQGSVYTATDENTKQLVIVKESWKQLVKIRETRKGEAVYENFLQEKNILKFLSKQTDRHPCFAQFIAEWDDPFCYYYAMARGDQCLFEYIEEYHHNMNDIEKLELMKEPNEWVIHVQDLFKQLVECTSWIHSKNVCHLDLSLENVMIDNDAKKVQIIDFGVAQYYKDFRDNKRVGKTLYMAPEVYCSQVVYDPRKADIWSLGVMLCMMLTGLSPYKKPVVGAENCSFRLLIEGKLYYLLERWGSLPLVTQDALDLMNKIFKYESKRICMDEILKHSFLNVGFNNNN